MGHAGTLDPLASGLLLVGIGSATRLVEFTHRLDKSYEARIRLGATSPTDDADGLWEPRADATEVSLEAIQSVLPLLIGPEVMQTPPAYSAIHMGGKRSYELARAGQEVELAARPVRIDRIQVVAYQWPFLDVVVDCGAGTYIRSIARDLGALLGVGGMIETLRRTRIGSFDVSQATDIEAVESPDDLLKCLIPSRVAISNWPTLELNAEQLFALIQGRRLQPGAALESAPEGTEVAILDDLGGLAGLGRVERHFQKPVIQPFRVFVAQEIK